MIVEGWHKNQGWARESRYLEIGRGEWFYPKLDLVS